MIVAAVVVAAGSGERLGAGVPKAFVEIAGRPLLVHALSRFLQHPGVRDVVVVAPPALVESAAELAPAVVAVPGGRTRQESVARGLAALATDIEAVLVHDSARAFVPEAVISRVIAALDDADAVVPCVPVADTLRRADADGGLGELVERDTLLAMQTPQGFRRGVLVEAHERAVGDGAPDDAALVQELGVRVVSVPGDEAAFKITVAADLVRAEAMLGSSA